MKLYYVDNFETKLSETEIRERLKKIAVEDKFFNLDVKEKKIYNLEFKENMASFFYLSCVGVQDMLAPRIYIKILKKDEGCICCIAAYVLGIWMARKRRISAYNKALAIKEEL